MLTDKQFNDAFTAAGGRFFANNYEYLAENINLDTVELVDSLYPLGYDVKKSGTRVRVSCSKRLINNNCAILALKKVAQSKQIQADAVNNAKRILRERFNITEDEFTVMKHRYLTKSRFKLAMECPTKLFYDGKSEYVNNKLEDSFLRSLADGGFQVGELAACYFQGGTKIKTKDHEEALEETNELLKQEKVIIYEAAVRYEKLFIRADILVKDGNNIDLIEVKAKSFDSNEKTVFLNKKGEVNTKWLPYFQDVAFQKYVLCSAFPEYNISAYLMMADKSKLCTIDGLNQKFKIIKDKNGNKRIVVSQNLTKEDLAAPILTKVNVDDICDKIYGEKRIFLDKQVSYKKYVELIADYYVRDEKISSPISKICGKCEYKATEDEKESGLKNGFHECCKERLNCTEDDFKESTVFDIWNFKKKDDCIGAGRIKISDISEGDISPESDDKPGISSSERQWLQVQKYQNNDNTYWIDKENLSCEMRKWTYPLHFIDFETSMVAIPFNKGRHPYEGIAFQFSHHVVYEDGRVEHHGEYLNTTPGIFPNYEFIRRLKIELDRDEGSIFRYAPHENTYLNIIYKQLMEDEENILDREEFCEFIKSITKSVKDNPEHWEGSRNMIDMWELVKRYYYDPAMGGSNSIKKVLPAILNSSTFLQDKYSKPIYGAADGIKSLNYENQIWIKYDGDKVFDPYKLLPKMFMDVTDKDFKLMSDDDEINQGGAALTAYAKMQFEEMTDYERSEISKALLKYCELDTLAMVMIYEGWRDMVK